MRPPPLPRSPGPAEGTIFALCLILLDYGISLVYPPSAPSLSSAGLVRLTSVRAVEIALFAVYFCSRGSGIMWLGLGKNELKRGLAAGASGSVVLASGALLAEAAMRLAGKGSFLRLVSGPPGLDFAALVPAALLFGPLFEELLFRALLYAPLRKRFGVLPALTLTTVLFAGAHMIGAGARLPWVQSVGGAFFCLALEYSGSMLAPFMIHALGNAAIFLMPRLLP